MPLPCMAVYGIFQASTMLSNEEDLVLGEPPWRVRNEFPDFGLFELCRSRQGVGCLKGGVLRASPMKTPGRAPRAQMLLTM